MVLVQHDSRPSIAPDGCFYSARAGHPLPPAAELRVAWGEVVCAGMGALLKILGGIQIANSVNYDFEIFFRPK